MGLFRRKSGGATTRTAARDQRAQITIGVPGRCPECDGFGYIDHIDIVNSFQQQHCIDCGHRWEYDFDDNGVVIDLTSVDEVVDLTQTPNVVSTANEHTVEPPGDWVRR